MELDHDYGKITKIQTLDTSTLPPQGGTSGLLSVIGTGGVLLPSGTTGQRPSASSGLIRYNSTTKNIEFCQGTTPSWYTLDSNSLNIVSQASDLPAPVAGVITLDNDTAYIIKGNVNIGTNTITLGNNSVILGFNEAVDGITYTGTGTLFTASNKNVEINGCFIVCSTGTVFSINGSGSEHIHLEHVWFNGCKSLGSVGNMLEFRSDSCQYQNTTVGGIALYGTVSHVRFHNNISSGSSGRTLDLDSTTINDGAIDGNIFIIPSSQYGIYAGSVAVTYQVLINGNAFSGSGTYLSGITSGDDKFEISGNSGVADSQHVGEFYMSANGTATTIAASNTYYKIAGTTVAGSNSQFTHTTGRLTSNSRLPRIYLITGAMTLTCGSNNQDVVVSIYKNGSIISSSEMSVRLGTASDPYPVTIQSLASLTINDYIEVYIKNITGANNVTVSYINLTVR